MTITLMKMTSACSDNLAENDTRNNPADPQSEASTVPSDDVDVIAHATGNFGHWQLLITFLLSLFNIPCTWHIYAPTFHARETDLWCSRPPDFASIDHVLWRNYTQPTSVCSIIEHDSINISQGIQGIEGIMILPDAKTVACSSWEFNSSGDTIISDFSLVCDRKHLINLAEAMFLVGVTFGGFVGGVISDRYGRKTTLMSCVFLQSLLGVLIAVSPVIEVYIVLRTLLGFISVSIVFSGFVLVMELVGGKWRTISGISYLLPVSLSYIFIAGMGYLIQNWRMLQLAISLPGLSFLALWWVIPESPRWLLTMERHEQLMIVLQKAAKFNNVELPSDLDKHLVAIKRDTVESTVSSGSVMDLFRTYRMMTITLLLFVIWFAVYLIYYGLVLNMGNLSGDLYINSAISGLVEVPALAVSILCLLYTGRRWPLALTMAFAGMSCFITIFGTSMGFEAHNGLAIIFPMIAKLLISSSNAVMPVFTAELFPTKIRNVGVGASNVPAGIALILVPYLWELAAMHPYVPMGLLAGCGVVGGVCVLFLPETGTKALSDDIS